MERSYWCTVVAYNKSNNSKPSLHFQSAHDSQTWSGKSIVQVRCDTATEFRRVGVDGYLDAYNMERSYFIVVTYFGKKHYKSSLYLKLQLNHWQVDPSKESARRLGSGYTLLDSVEVLVGTGHGGKIESWRGWLD